MSGTACVHEWESSGPDRARRAKCRICGSFYESQQERAAREKTEQDLSDYYAGKGQKFYGMP